MLDLLAKGLQEYGVAERSGHESNSPRILYYAKSVGMNWVKYDEVAWCSIFINFLAKECGYERTGKPNAKSWLEIGEEVKTPEIGDIVVFWRDNPKSWKGHVALYINEDDKFIYVLGGNQNNQVKISSYSKERLEGYRRLRKLS
jgi:uncharacterized protein (TIGR02594 family)